jgi:hypothetical protein
MLDLGEASHKLTNLVYCYNVVENLSTANFSQGNWREAQGVGHGAKGRRSKEQRVT